MTHKRFSFTLALIVLAAAALACNAPTASPALQNPPPTVTPYVAGTSPAETVPAAPTIPAETQAAATAKTPPEATATPTPTETPTPTATLPTPTATRRPVNEGPLDFAAPTSVYSWEQQADGAVRVVLKITITGGAPPFTVSHGGVVDGQTWEREYYIHFVRQGCGGIPQSITVQSADGQTISKDYWIGVEQQPWCSS
jgi:hypothetical protein